MGIKLINILCIFCNLFAKTKNHCNHMKLYVIRMTNILIQSTLRCLQRNIIPKIRFTSVRKYSITKKTMQLSLLNNSNYKHHQWQSNRKEMYYSLGLSLSFFGLFKSKEKEDPEVISTIKSSILLIQKAEYKKAESMLHIALRQAQDIQHNDAITYIYDLMANLAFIQEDYQKAEKLFNTVMKRLLSQGVPENDLRIIHMSLKLAKMYEHQTEYEKATIGYNYCLDHLEKLIVEGNDEKTILTFYGMTLDWYARMLVAQNKFKEALKFFLKAYEVSIQIHGKVHPENVVLLNDLGTLSCHLGNDNEAISYIQNAIEIGEQIPDISEISVMYINLGNVYIKKKMYEEAKKWCLKGWKSARSKNDDESLKESKICLDEVNKFLP